MCPTLKKYLFSRVALVFVRIYALRGALRTRGLRMTHKMLFIGNTKFFMDKACRMELCLFMTCSANFLFSHE